VSAFRVKLSTNDLNYVDVPLNPTHSLAIDDRYCCGGCVINTICGVFYRTMMRWCRWLKT